jgi:hypothetical protein
MVHGISKEYLPTLFNIDKIGYNDISFSSKLVSNESQLCSYGETRFG